MFEHAAAFLEPVALGGQLVFQPGHLGAGLLLVFVFELTQSGFQVADLAQGAHHFDATDIARAQQRLVHLQLLAGQLERVLQGVGRGAQGFALLREQPLLGQHKIRVGLELLREGGLDTCGFSAGTDERRLQGRHLGAAFFKSGAAAVAL